MEIKFSKYDKEDLYKFLLKNSFNNWDRKQMLREVAREMVNSYFEKISEEEFDKLLRGEVRKVCRMRLIKNMIANDERYNNLMKAMSSWRTDLHSKIKLLNKHAEQQQLKDKEAKGCKTK